VPVAENEIGGVVRDPQGTPIPYAMIYLFEQMADSSPEHGVMSELTDINGWYWFRGIPRGTYRIQPGHTGIEFDPLEAIVNSGELAPNFTATYSDLFDAGCVRREKASDIHNADRGSRNIMNNAIKLIRKYRAVAESRPKKREIQILLSSLIREEARLAYLMDQVIRQSEILPKVTLACGDPMRCGTRIYNHHVRAYRLNARGLYSSTRRILRRAQQYLGNGLTRNIRYETGKANADWSRALRNMSRLPNRTDVCKY